MRVCVEGGLLVDPVNDFEGVGTVWIEDGVIACVKTERGLSGKIPEWDGSVSKTDARGKWIIPGLVDMHVHFREPGGEYKEDVASGCRAAKKGGFTKVCCMPNTNPAADCGEVVSYITGKAAEGVEVFVAGAVTKGQTGTELADIDGMARAGIRALTEDGKSVMNARLMREAMTKARALGLPYLSHAEDENLAGLPVGEEIIIARDILLAEETGCRLHLCHVSTEGSVRLIRPAKAAGLNVTAETAPHYFTLHGNGAESNGNRKMNPPLRGKKDVEAIKTALKDGIIDAIATDHAPHAREEKELSFEKAPNGVIGLETSFAVSYTALVKPGILTPLELIRRMSTNPAKILGLKPSSISAGEAADIVTVDVRERYIIGSEAFASKSANSPFMGMEVWGRPAFLP